MKTIKMTKLIFTLLMLVNFVVYGQNVPMGNGNWSGCSGTFYDSGGNGGNYSANENLTYTLCPDIPGSFLTVDFTQFTVENGFELLTIYNGATTGAPTLGSYSGAVVPGIVQGNNPTGCLTFVFTSDGSVQQAGWAGTISCSQPFQTV